MELQEEVDPEIQLIVWMNALKDTMTIMMLQE
jgi:hypothetical protein